MRLLVGSFVLVCTSVYSAAALAYPAECNRGSDTRCVGDRMVRGNPELRWHPPVIQPRGASIQTHCSGMTDPTMSYRAQWSHLTCGEGVVNRIRLPHRHPTPVIKDWKKKLYGGSADRARSARMQEMLRYDVNLKGQIQFPMTETYTYVRKVGDWTGPNEPWNTTCAYRKERYEITGYHKKNGQCVDWEEPPPPPPPAPSAGFGDSSGGSGYSSPYSGGSMSSSSGSNRDESSSSSATDRNADRYMDAVGDCVAWAQVDDHSRPIYDWVYDSDVEVPCTVYTPSWEVRDVVTPVTSMCPAHTANYTVQYTRDPNWKWETAQGNPKPYRDYNHYLPNKYDLLPGESEELYIYANSGQGRDIRPSLSIQSKWNQYTYSAAVAANGRYVPAIQCQYGVKPNVMIRVHTIGRNKTKAPSLLALPVNDRGQMIDPFGNEFNRVKDFPATIKIQDGARAQMLLASTASKSFPRPDKARDRDAKLYMQQNTKLSAADAYNMVQDSFFVDAQYRLQVFRRDRGGLTRMGPIKKFTDREVNVDDDKVTIFAKVAGSHSIYQGTGAFESVLGPVWRAFGASLSPNAKYFVRVQSVQRAFPFYESGCKDGRDICDGEEADDKAFGTPLNIDFQADKKVKRSLLQTVVDHYRNTSF